MKRTVTTVDPALLATYNAGVQRARDAYRRQPHVGLTYRCDCGRRTQSDAGRCETCQEKT